MLLAPLKISKTLPASGHDTGRQPKSSSSQPVPPCSPSPLPFFKVPPCLQLPSLLTSGISALSSLIPSSQQSRMKPTPTEHLPLLSSSPCYSHPLCSNGRPASSHLSCQEHNFQMSFACSGFATFNFGACLFRQFWAWAAPFVPPHLSSPSSYRYLIYT